MDLEPADSFDREQRPGDDALIADEDVADTTESKQGRRNLYIGLVVLVVLILAGLYFLSSHGGDSTENASVADSRAVVTVIRPGSDSVVREISASGTLTARRSVPIGVVGEGGRVVRVMVDEGDWVKKGQALIMIDQSVQNRQVEASAAQVDVARADLALAQNELDRALALVDRGFISKADLDRKRADRDAAAARLRVARANVNELRARNARLNIYAPASGIILERNVEVGQVVAAGSNAIFTLAEGGEMELGAQLSEEDLARVSVGTPAVVTPVGTAEKVEGKIWQIAPTISADSRQGLARIALPYTDQLRPGGFASAVIRAGAVTAPVIPESALQSDDKGSYVYVVGKDNKVERRPVKTGLITDSGVAVISGLSGNERVVLRAGAFLNPGETVKPRLVKSAQSM